MNEEQTVSNTTTKKLLIRKIVLLSSTIFIFLYLFITLFERTSELEIMSNVYHQILEEKHNVEKQLTSCNNALNFKNSATAPGSNYASYEPPMYPGHTIGWKMYISEPNNILFLYPEDFIVKSVGDVEYQKIELSGPEDKEIMVMRSSEVNVIGGDQKLKFEDFVKNLKAGKPLQSPEGYAITKNPERQSDEDIVYFIETDEDSGTAYSSVYIHQRGTNERTFLRTEGLDEDDLRALVESFKYLR